MPKPPPYLDSRAVAERLHVKVRTVHDYRSTGRLPEPDAWFGNSPVWLPKTIERHITQLPPTAAVHRERRAS